MEWSGYANRGHIVTGGCGDTERSNRRRDSTEPFRRTQTVKLNKQPIDMTELHEPLADAGFAQ